MKAGSKTDGQGSFFDIGKFRRLYFSLLTYFIIAIPAAAPSPTAFDTCKSPPVQSPAAKRPFTFVIIESLTLILPPILAHVRIV